MTSVTRHAVRLRLIDPPDNPDWRRRAACRGVDPEEFFPTIPAGPTPDGADEHPLVRRAKAICAGCPVAGQCREFALAIPAIHGVWGGMSEDELRAERRRRLRRANAAATPPNPTGRTST